MATGIRAVKPLSAKRHMVLLGGLGPAHKDGCTRYARLHRMGATTHRKPTQVLLGERHQVVMVD